MLKSYIQLYCVASSCVGRRLLVSSCVVLGWLRESEPYVLVGCVSGVSCGLECRCVDVRVLWRDLVLVLHWQVVGTCFVIL